MLNFATNPAVNGIHAIDNNETGVTTANKGSDFAKPLKTSNEVSLFSFST